MLTLISGPSPLSSWSTTASVDTAEEFRRTHLKPTCETHDRGEPGLTLGALEERDLGAVQPAGRAQRLLRETATMSLSPKIASKALVRLHAAPCSLCTDESSTDKTSRRSYTVTVARGSVAPPARLRVDLRKDSR